MSAYTSVRYELRAAAKQIHTNFICIQIIAVRNGGWQALALFELVRAKKGAQIFKEEKRERMHSAKWLSGRCAERKTK